MEESCAILDVAGEVCPVPLVKTRKSLEKLKENEVLIVIGDSIESEREIIMAVKELGMELIGVETDKDGKWHIFIRKKKVLK